MRKPDYNRRVVVTGMGVVSPIGNDLDTVWSNLVKGDPHFTLSQVALNDVMVRLEENLMAQRRFIADASHELRTPLTAIRGYAELFDAGALQDQEGAQRAGAAMPQIRSRKRAMNHTGACRRASRCAIMSASLEFRPGN